MGWLTLQVPPGKMSYSYYLLCTNCTTLMYIDVINVMYTYIMLRTMKPTYLMTVYWLRSPYRLVSLEEKKLDVKLVSDFLTPLGK